MTTLKAHFDGRQIVLDEPVPAGIAPNTPVTVVLGELAATNGETGGGGGRSVLERIADLAVADDTLPRDYAEQHEHYVKGAPRRE